jgi:hypothetical protein
MMARRARIRQACMHGPDLQGVQGRARPRPLRLHAWHGMAWPFLSEGRPSDSETTTSGGATCMTMHDERPESLPAGRLKTMSGGGGLVSGNDALRV